MTKENLIELGANLVAFQYLTRWTCDPTGEKMEDYVFEDNLSLMWDIWRDQLAKLGGKSFSTDAYSLDYFEQAIWQHCNKVEPDFHKMLEEAVEEHNDGYREWNNMGKKAKDFYKGYIEIIVEAALKLGAITEKNQGYIKKQN